MAKEREPKRTRTIRYRFGDPEIEVRSDLRALKNLSLRSYAAIEDAVLGIAIKHINHNGWKTQELVDWVFARRIFPWRLYPENTSL